MTDQDQNHRCRLPPSYYRRHRRPSWYDRHDAEYRAGGHHSDGTSTDQREPRNLRRPTSNTSLRRELRRIHPPEPPSGPDVSPVILPMRGGRNSGFEHAPDSESETEERPPEEGSHIADDGRVIPPLPPYAPTCGNPPHVDWTTFAGYLNGPGRSRGALPLVQLPGATDEAPPYVPDAEDDEHSSVYSGPGGIARSRAGSITSQNQDPSDVGRRWSYSLHPRNAGSDFQSPDRGHRRHRSSGSHRRHYGWSRRPRDESPDPGNGPHSLGRNTAVAGCQLSPFVPMARRRRLSAA